MILFLILFTLLSFNSFAGDPVQTGEIITANRFNNGTFMVGDIKHSLLSVTKFQEIAGDCWVKMEGQDISGSDYATIMGVNVLPNASGRFLRDIGGNAPSLAQTQEDAIRNITGQMTSNYISSNPNNGTGALRSSIQQTSNRYAYHGGSYWGAKVDFDASLAVPTAAENRPVNLGVNLFVKINNDCSN